MSFRFGSRTSRAIWRTAFTAFRSFKTAIAAITTTALIKEDLALLNVHHDIFFSERTLHERKDGVSEIDRMLKEMRDAAGAFWLASVYPRSGPGAGLELVTATSVVSIAPELAAERMRAVD